MNMQSNILDKILNLIKRFIPKPVFLFFQPAYHALLAYAGAAIYGFPSRRIKVIGVTGTKGKSTVTFLTTKIFEGAGKSVAMIGSLGYKIKDKEWPNTLKMTMPGRFKLQKFIRDAAKAGCEYLVMEVTSEGISQKRHIGISFDCAVFTNIHKEHIESHGSFENYRKAKQELFRCTQNIHVVNADDPDFESFSSFPAKRTIFFGVEHGADMRAQNVELTASGSSFNIYGTRFNSNLVGAFNVSNCLAALATAAMYGVDLETSKPILEKIEKIAGRMEFVHRQPNIIIDYAHTPDSLEAVYKTLRQQLPSGGGQEKNGKLICVLGAAGGGRDTWKRPEFGRLAEKYCDGIFLTDEDPYEENPMEIIKQIESGFGNLVATKNKYRIIIDRRQAIETAVKSAQPADTVIITGKGSEVSMAVAGGKKIPWSDKDLAIKALG